jgi:hypothetical protein
VTERKKGEGDKRKKGRKGKKKRKGGDRAFFFRRKGIPSLVTTMGRKYFPILTKLIYLTPNYHIYEFAPILLSIFLLNPFVGYTTNYP